MTCPTATLTREQLDARLQALILEIDELPSIPETLIEILKVLDDPDSGASDLAAVIRLDAPLMARILRLANSPYYSARGDITDINRCVTVLGYRTVRQVAICVSVATSVISAMSKSKGRIDYRELWRHSVVAAAVAKHLALLAGYPDPEEAFTAGLLHDLGKFVLELHAPEVYYKVVSDRAADGRMLTEVEEDTFGFHHALIGQAFAKSWRFPDILTRAFGEHHELRVGSALTREDRIVALISLSDYLANTVEPVRSDLGFDPRHVDALRLHDVAGVSVAQVQNTMDQMKDSISFASAYLDMD